MKAGIVGENCSPVRYDVCSDIIWRLRATIARTTVAQSTSFQIQRDYG